MFCGDTIGTLWPKPSGHIEVDHMLLHINKDTIEFHMPSFTKQAKLWDANRDRFMDILQNKVPNVKVLKSEGHPLKISIELNEADKSNMEVPRLTLDTDESYHIEISTSSDHEVLAKISAKTYFGARHGLETLSQLIVYDDIRRELLILAKVSIEDSPSFKWRGLLLDTSRNFYSTKAIKRTLGKCSGIQLVECFNYPTFSFHYRCNGYG